MDIINRLERLPAELQNLIWEYNPEHRRQHRKVMDELVAYYEEMECDNEMCDGWMFQGVSVMRMVIGTTHYFCCDHCASYGAWSIRYDFRKYTNTFAQNRSSQSRSGSLQ
jgi:hypothetical protein